MRLLSIDPGDRHVGVVTWEATGHDWSCTQGVEMTPEGCTNLLEHLVDLEVVRVVVEQFRLYVWAAQELSFKELHTSELIGVIKYLVHKQGVEYVGQPATIKNVVRRIAKARGMVPCPGSIHVKDAWLHGAFYLMREGVA